MLWHALADRFGYHDADQSVGSDSRTARIRHGGVWTGDVFRVPGRASQGKQEFGVVCHPGLSRGLFRAELGRTEGAEGLASDDRLFGRIAEPGWVLMNFKNHFKCRMGL